MFCLSIPRFRESVPLVGICSLLPATSSLVSRKWAVPLDEGEGKQFKIRKAKPDAANKYLTEALLDKPAEAADTLGHIEYKSMVEKYSSFLAEEGDMNAAAASLHRAKETLAARNVLHSVIEDMEKQIKQYESKTL